MSGYLVDQSFETAIYGVLDNFIYKVGFPLKQVQDQSFDKVCYKFGKVVEIILADYILSSDKSYSAAHKCVNTIYNYLSVVSPQLYDSPYIGHLTVSVIIKQVILSSGLRAESLTDLFLLFSQHILMLSLRMAMCADDDTIVSEGILLLFRMRERL